MAHDATKVLLGTTTSSAKVISCENEDPATFPAGTAVRRATDGGLQTEDDSTAALVGISLGKSLSNDKKTSVVRKGLGIPLRQKLEFATGIVTIGTYADLLDGGFDEVTVGDVSFVAQAGAATLGQATFRAATTDAATAISLAAQINAHDDLDGIVTAVADGDTVIVTADVGGADGNEIVLEFVDNTGNTAITIDVAGTLEDGSDGPAVLGQVVYVNDDGFGCPSGDGDAAATGGTYASGPMTGIDEAAAEVSVALVDIAGTL